MKKLIAFSLATLTVLLMLTGCQSLPKITVSSTDDLANLKIGVQSGTTGESLAQEYASDVANVLSFKSGMDAALDLKNGGCDAVMIDELPAKNIVAQNDDLEIIDLNMAPEEYAIAVKKGNTELLEKINATLERMTSDGTFDALSNAFMPADGNIVIPADKATEGDEVIKMGTNPAFHPFEYLEGTKIVGFDISMSQEIAADMGKKLEVVNMEFDSLLAALASDQIDFVAAGLSIKPERLENADFSTYYYTSKQVIIVRK